MVNEKYDAGDEKQVHKRKTKVQLAQERNNVELEKLVDTPGGAYFIWRLLCQCGIYNASPIDRNEIFIQEGKRQIGLWALSELINIDENLYTKVRLIGSQRDGE
jgi:hypothetical protein